MSIGTQRTVAVLCVDNHPGFRRVLYELVAATAGFAHVGEASCSVEAIGAVEVLAPDLVLMDMRMSGGDGVDTARFLLARHSRLVVVLTTADPIASPARFTELGLRATMVRKQDLCPALLRDLWRERKTRYGPNWVMVQS